MRYRVQFRFREDTGEVEMFRVETVDADARAADHDTAHDRVAAEVAGIVESDALIEEVAPARQAVPQQTGPRQAREEQEQETRTATQRTQSA
jgi:hypothetical protein